MVNPRSLSLTAKRKERKTKKRKMFDSRSCEEFRVHVRIDKTRCSCCCNESNRIKTLVVFSLLCIDVYIYACVYAYTSVLCPYVLICGFVSCVYAHARSRTRRAMLPRSLDPLWTLKHARVSLFLLLLKAYDSTTIRRTNLLYFSFYL